MSSSLVAPFALVDTGADGLTPFAETTGNVGLCDTTAESATAAFSPPFQMITLPIPAIHPTNRDNILVLKAGRIRFEQLGFQV